MKTESTDFIVHLPKIALLSWIQVGLLILEAQPNDVVERQTLPLSRKRDEPARETTLVHRGRSQHGTSSPCLRDH